MAHENATPKEHRNTQVFSEREANDEVGTGPTPGEISKVKDRRRPVVFFAFEMLDTDDEMLEQFLRKGKSQKDESIRGLLLG